MNEPEATPKRKPPRLFVAAWPADDLRIRLTRIVDQLSAEPRKQGHEGVRWPPPESWHVTLAFLGSVTADPVELVAALREVDLAPAKATVGPELQLLGRGVLCVPVQGLDEMAATVREVTAPFAETPETRPFVGHITLARLGTRRHGQRRRGGLGSAQQWVGGAADGIAVSVPWTVDELTLTSSKLTPEGSIYYQEWSRCLHPGGWVGRWQERSGLPRPSDVDLPPGSDPRS